MHFPGDIELPGYLKGCFNQLFKIKKKHRHLKVILSIGGWTYSRNLAQGICNMYVRETFAKTAVKLMGDLGLDGLEIDWEYPDNKFQAEDFVDVLKAMRIEMDIYTARVGLPADQFELTVATPAGPSQYKKLLLAQMDPSVSFWNIMCYDYAGPWSFLAQYHSNLFFGDYSCDTAIKHYLAAGIHPSKVVLGMPLYGRSFANTEGHGKPYWGVGGESWEPDGTLAYKSLPRQGETTDMTAVVAWNFDSVKRIFFSYDNVPVTRAKADYIKQNKLGGGMWWESYMDMPQTSNESLIMAFGEQIGPDNLDRKPNCLHYPESPYINIRNINGTK